jgi:hypothetical protein
MKSLFTRVVFSGAFYQFIIESTRIAGLAISQSSLTYVAFYVVNA